MFSLTGKMLSVAAIEMLLFAGSQMLQAQSAVEYSSAISKAGSSKARPVNQKPSFASAPDPAAANRSSHLPARSDPAPDLTNRRALEETAGKDAAKLLVRSEPTGAQVWVNDDLYVGKTPVLLILSPGSYQLKLRGGETKFSERRISVLPSEQRTVVVPLQSRYPTQVHLP